MTPTVSPTKSPTVSPTITPTIAPTVTPTVSPTISPTVRPTISPTANPSANPTADPTFNPTANPTANTTSNPTANPSFSPAVAGAVPTITVFLKGNSALLTDPELAALKVGFLDKLDAESAGTFDRSNIVAELSSDDSVFQADAFFKLGSGVDIAEAHAIASAIQYVGSVVTPDGGATRYEIAYALAKHAGPPTPTQTLSAFITPTESPSSSKPSVAPSTPAPTCVLTTSLVTSDYCPCGYHDYGVRYSRALGRITIVRSHQQCADRCTTFSGPEYSGGCRGFMTGMYINMLFCRSYGSETRETTCAFWANPTHPGQFSGPLGSIRPHTHQENVGGNCCSNSTFVDIEG